MNTDYIKEFITVAHVCSFTGAAKLLFTSAASITRHIQSLEKELGLQLIERNPHHVKLTHNGKFFLHVAEEINVKLENCISAMKGEHSLENNRLVIAVHYADSALDLSESIDSFTELYPNININLLTTDDRDFYTLLTLKQADIAIELFSPENILDNIAYIPVGNSPMLLGTSKQQGVNTGSTLKKILDGKLILIPSFGHRKSTDRFIQTLEKRHHFKTTGIIETEDAENMFLKASMDEGVALFPKQYSRYAPTSVQILEFQEIPNVPIVALWSTSRQNPNIAMLISLLKEIQ